MAFALQCLGGLVLIIAVFSALNEVDRKSRIPLKDRLPVKPVNKNSLRYVIFGGH